MTEEKKRLRHGLLYSAITLALTWGLQSYLIISGKVHEILLIGLMMWIPGIVALVYAKITGLGFSSFGFKQTKLKYICLAIFIPWVLAILTNFISGIFGMRTFALMPGEILKTKVVVILLAFAVGLIGALGEELGWRGFLLPQLIEAKVRRPYWCSGFIWAIWHLPLVTLGSYYLLDEPLLIGAVYTFSIISLGFVIGKIRMLSGSLWTAALLHASHNFFFQIFVPQVLFTKTGSNMKWWAVVAADCGVVVGLLYLFTAVILFRKSLSNTTDAGRVLEIEA